VDSGSAIRGGGPAPRGLIRAKVSPWLYLFLGVDRDRSREESGTGSTRAPSNILEPGHVAPHPVPPPFNPVASRPAGPDISLLHQNNSIYRLYSARRVRASLSPSSERPSKRQPALDLPRASRKIAPLHPQHTRARFLPLGASTINPRRWSNENFAYRR